MIPLGFEGITLHNLQNHKRFRCSAFFDNSETLPERPCPKDCNHRQRPQTATADSDRKTANTDSSSRRPPSIGNVYRTQIAGACRTSNERVCRWRSIVSFCNHRTKYAVGRSSRRFATIERIGFFKPLIISQYRLVLPLGPPPSRGTERT